MGPKFRTELVLLRLLCIIIALFQFFVIILYTPIAPYIYEITWGNRLKGETKANPGFEDRGAPLRVAQG